MYNKRGGWRHLCSVSNSIKREGTPTYVRIILRNGYLRRTLLREHTPPPHARAVAESSGDNPINVLARGDPKGFRVDDSSPDTQGKHRHPGDWPVLIAVEGGGVNY